MQPEHQPSARAVKGGENGDDERRTSPGEILQPLNHHQGQGIFERGRSHWENFEPIRRPGHVGPHVHLESLYALL